MKIRYKIGELVKLSKSEKWSLFNDTGYSAAEIHQWNIGIVLCHVSPGEGDFAECESYKVKWWPSGDIIEETDDMITYMDTE